MLHNDKRADAARRPLTRSRRRPSMVSMRRSMCVLASAVAAGGGLALRRRSGHRQRSQGLFPEASRRARMMVRWWWFGPSVTKPELEREMRAMKQGGIGGVRSAAHLSAGIGRPGDRLPQLPLSVAGISRRPDIYRSQGQRTGAAHGSDSGQRLAVRRAAHPHLRSGRQAGGEPRAGARRRHDPAAAETGGRRKADCRVSGKRRAALAS